MVDRRSFLARLGIIGAGIAAGRITSTSVVDRDVLTYSTRRLYFDGTGGDTYIVLTEDLMRDSALNVELLVGSAMKDSLLSTPEGE